MHDTAHARCPGTPIGSKGGTDRGGVAANGVVHTLPTREDSGPTMPTEISAARDEVVHAERVRGRGQATRYYLGEPDHGRRHPGDLHGPLSTTKQPPTHPGPTNAAAWPATGCDVGGPSTSTPTAGRPPQNHPPTAPPQATQNLASGTTTHQEDHAGAGSGTTSPTANQPTMRRLAPPNTDHAAIAPTPRLQTDHTQTGKNRTGGTCKGQNRNGVLRTGDTMVRHARRRPHPQTQQRTTPLPLYNGSTNDGNLQPTPCRCQSRSTCFFKSSHTY